MRSSGMDLPILLETPLHVGVLAVETLGINVFFREDFAAV